MHPAKFKFFFLNIFYEARSLILQFCSYILISLFCYFFCETKTYQFTYILIILKFKAKFDLYQIHITLIVIKFEIER